MMKKLTVLLFILVGLLIVGCQGAVSETAVSPTAAPATLETGDGEGVMAGALPAELVAQLDAFLQSQVYTEGGDPKGAAPGLVLYVQIPDGVYLNSAGVANLEDGAPMPGNGRLEIGSNTKSMTIVLLMQLVEEGLISLDDPLSQYLPDQAALFENGDQITIRQLAQHTAGLYDYADNIMAAGISDPTALEASFAPEQLVQDAADNGIPYFAPGAEGQWHYSNTGYVLIGMILESLTGEKVADLYQSRIFDPLGMESAIFLENVPQAGDLDSHGYWWNPDSTIVDTTNWNGSQGWVAGSAAMTAEDLATYGKALAAGELFQNPDTLQEMLTWDEAAKFSVGGAYGLGLLDFAGDGSVWGHAGQTLGFQSLWFIDPAQDIVVIGLTNSASYEAYRFLNVLNILTGNGLLPIGSTTLLPIGFPTQWQWAQFVSPTEATDIDETMVYQLTFAVDQTATLFTPDCGVASGAYTVAGTGNIDLELDGSALTCEADSLAVQAVEQLNTAETWRFDNGRLLIDLPVDGGAFVFKTYVPATNTATTTATTTAAPTDEEVQSWRWVSLTDAEENETAIDEDHTYNFSLVGDLLIIGTGCRVTTGDYQIEGETISLTFDTPEVTDTSCDEGPYADQFYDLLQKAQAVFFEQDQMIIVSLDDTGAPIGTLTFAPLATE